MIHFAVAIFLSAFLLFQVQPLIARFILPWFGGSPSVWTACMLFFQAVLLIGYAYAHVLNRYLPGKRQFVAHAVLLLVSFLFLPIIPAEYWKPDGEQPPVTGIIVLLAATIGAPYVLLSATSPLLQAWFSRMYPDRSPFRLFALSNLGSLLALFSYPFLFEPNMRLTQQATLWSAGILRLRADLQFYRLSFEPVRFNRSADWTEKERMLDRKTDSRNVVSLVVPDRIPVDPIIGHHQPDLSGGCRNAVSVDSAFGTVPDHLYYQF